VVAGQALINGADFKEMFRMLNKDYGFNQDRSFNITSRMFQGGGFLKDIVYLRGVIQVVNYIKTGGRLEPLLAGKFSLKHLPVINELTERGLLSSPAILPRYLTHTTAKENISNIKKDLPIYKLAHS
jgi:hypothetical protein